MMGLETTNPGDMGARDAPPVNNACMPDIYNKLDAETIEKTRVVNALLDVRLSIQDRVLNKYRSAAERSFSKERDRVRSELRDINKRLPNYADIPNLESKIMKIKRRRKSNPQHNCRYTTEPREIKGIPAEKDDKPFCNRFFTHHQPTKASWYKDLMPSINKGLSMPDLRARRKTGTRITHAHVMLPASEQHVHEMDGANSRHFPAIHSLDDNFVTSRGTFRDDDDTKTV